jgi:hypothetical protein
MCEVIATGAVFRFNVEGGGHYWFLISDVKQDRNALAVVSMTTTRRGARYDPGCPLHVGDHPEIRHDSYVSYIRSGIHTPKSLLNSITLGHLHPVSSPCSESLLRRLRQGAFISKETPKGIRDLLRKQGFGPPVPN